MNPPKRLDDEVSVAPQLLPTDFPAVAEAGFRSKERLLPPLYWRGMLKGREWLARPRATA